MHVCNHQITTLKHTVSYLIYVYCHTIPLLKGSVIIIHDYTNKSCQSTKLRYFQIQPLTYNEGKSTCCMLNVPQFIATSNTNNIQDSNTNIQDSNTNIQDSNTNIQDSNTNTQDSNTNIQDSNTYIQGSNTNIQDSNTNIQNRMIL